LRRAALVRSQRFYFPTYAAFNLIGDPDMRGREFLTELMGLNSHGYWNSTLVFNLVRTLRIASPTCNDG
jgi:hypothetical protein